MNTPSKKELRDTYRKIRQNLSQTQQHQHALAVYEHLTSHPNWKNWQQLAFYWPNDGELSLLPLLQEARRQGKSCYLPCLTPEGTLQFGLYIENTPLHKNPYNIWEPEATVFKSPKDLEVVFLPLVAFDTTGNRLGMGKGYYDKTFAFKKSNQPPTLIGIAHDCQKTNQLLTDPWDIPLDFILTESGII